MKKIAINTLSTVLLSLFNPACGAQDIVIKKQGNLITLSGELNAGLLKEEYPKGYGITINIVPEMLDNDLAGLAIVSSYFNPATKKFEQRGLMTLNKLKAAELSLGSSPVFLADFKANRTYGIGISRITSKDPHQWTVINAADYITINPATAADIQKYGSYKPLYLKRLLTLTEKKVITALIIASTTALILLAAAKIHSNTQDNYVVNKHFDQKFTPERDQDKIRAAYDKNRKEGLDREHAISSATDNFYFNKRENYRDQLISDPTFRHQEAYKDL